MLIHIDAKAAIETRNSPELIFKSEKGQELLKELGVPEGYTHVCTMTLGYMDGDRPPAKPRNKEVVWVSFTHPFGLASSESPYLIYMHLSYGQSLLQLECLFSSPQQI